MVDVVPYCVYNDPTSTELIGRIIVKTYTAEHFLHSEAFMRVTVEDAIKTVAKTNGQTFELTAQALALQTPNVVRDVFKLVQVAAEHCASEANAGRLWA